MHTLKWPAITNAATSARSAAIARRRLHDALPIDRRCCAPSRRDSAEQLLARLLQEDLRPTERRPA